MPAQGQMRALGPTWLRRGVARLAAALLGGLLLPSPESVRTGTEVQLRALIGEPAAGLVFRAPVRGDGGSRAGDQAVNWRLDVHLPLAPVDAPELRRTAQAAVTAVRATAGAGCIGEPPPLADLFIVPAGTLPPRTQGLYAMRGGRGVMAVQLQAGRVPLDVVAHEVAHWWAASLCVVDADGDERLASASEGRFERHWPSPEPERPQEMWERVVRFGFPPEAFFRFTP